MMTHYNETPWLDTLRTLRDKYAITIPESVAVASYINHLNSCQHEPIATDWNARNRAMTVLRKLSTTHHREYRLLMAVIAEIETDLMYRTGDDFGGVA